MPFRSSSAPSCMTQLKRVTFGIVRNAPPTLVYMESCRMTIFIVCFCCVYSTRVDSHGTLCEVSISGRLEVPDCGRKKGRERNMSGRGPDTLKRMSLSYKFLSLACDVVVPCQCSFLLVLAEKKRMLCKMYAAKSARSTARPPR